MLLLRAERVRPPVVTAARRPWTASSQAGFLGLLGLSFALPFEATQRPLLHSSLITLTNLTALLYPVAALAVLVIWFDWRSRRQLRQRWSIAFFGAVLVCALLSSAVSAHRLDGLKWTLDLAVCGVLWQAVPVYLARETARGRRLILGAIVAGGGLAAVAGLLEVARPSLDADVLSIFKAKPTVIGPYLRLSGTFEYANTAGGYFAAILPLAIAGAASSVSALRAVRPANGRGRAAIRAVASVAAAGAIAAALALTFSRGAMLGALAGLAVMAIATRRRWPSAAPIRARILAVLVLVVLLAGGATALGLSGPEMLRLRTQSDLEWYRADLHGQTPARVRPDTLLKVPVGVRNPGPLVWHARGHAPEHLSYHWLLPNDKIMVLDGVRTQLPRDLRPGQSVVVAAKLLTPSRAGRYRLAWDIVAENLAWFSLRTGIFSSTNVDVAGRSGGATLHQQVLATPLAYPTAPGQPERGVLWAAAWRMMRSHPLLGVGPNGYRLSYGRYERPPQPHWDTRIYANSLPLEIGADLGIPGLLLFCAFLAAVAWSPLARAALTGRTDIWVAAGLAALCVLLAHGVVDYLFGSRAVLLLFGITLGLVSAPADAEASPEMVTTAAKIDTVPRK